MIKQPVFIVTSVIYFSNQALSYSNVRSIYTPEERSLQTVKTIASIKKRVPQALVVLVEMGLKERLPDDLMKIVDHYVYVGNRSLVRLACDGKYKGMGEVAGLIAAKKYFVGLGDFYFKISGRYFLLDDFNLNNWMTEKIVVLKYKDSISTRLYGFSDECFNIWYYALWKCIPYLLRGHSIEDVLPRIINKKHINEIELLGVAGFIGPDGQYVTE